MKRVARLFILTCLCRLLLTTTATAQTTIITMGATNTVYGNQGFLTSIYSPPVAINSFGVGGYNPGFAAANYYFTLTRSGDFTTSNLQFSIDGTSWVAGSQNARFIDNVTHYYGISGVIPYGAECGAKETVVMKIYTAYTYQLVKTTTFIITNPANPVPVPHFKVFGSTSQLPAIINGCECKSPDIFLSNVQLNYTGTGVVWKYRLIIKQTNASGIPIAGGFVFTQNWVNAPVPVSLVINTALKGTGSISGQIPATWTYYSIKLETTGGPCSGAYGTHTALVRLSPQHCIR